MTRVPLSSRTEVEHDVARWDVALRLVGARPKHQIAGQEFLELKPVGLLAHDGEKLAGLPRPNVLAARIARDIVEAVLRRR